MYYERTTAILCALGWLLHWLGDWGVAWRTQKQSLLTFAWVDPPKLIFSLVATLALYLIGPGLLSTFGVTLPGEANAIKLLSALVVGYLADSLITKVVALVRGGA